MRHDSPARARISSAAIARSRGERVRSRSWRRFLAAAGRREDEAALRNALDLPGVVTHPEQRRLPLPAIVGQQGSRPAAHCPGRDCRSVRRAGERPAPASACAARPAAAFRRSNSAPLPGPWPPRAKPSCSSQPALTPCSKWSPTHSPHHWLSATTSATERRQSGAAGASSSCASRGTPRRDAGRDRRWHATGASCRCRMPRDADALGGSDD
jgi:hypothetical protein